MKAFKKSRFGVLAVLAALVTAAPLSAAAVGTGFTYQGRLRDNAQAANGTYDFTFTLYDAASLGNVAGSTQVVNDLNVSGGLFTTTLDFGAVFDGKALWLEIGVRPGNSNGGYTPLTPRQALTATPYALYALSSAQWKSVGTAITNANTGFVGVNRSSPMTGSEVFGIRSATSSGYAGMYISTDGNNGKPFYGYAHGGNTNAWTYLDGATSKWHLYNNGTRLTVTDAGDIGIGTTSPDARLAIAGASADGLHVSSNAAFSYGIRASGVSAGVYGESGASGGAGVYGENNTSGGSGVEGHTDDGAGVAGYATNGTGVYGSTWFGWAVYGSNGGSNSNGYAGYFNGRVHVAGNLSKSSGSFKIDHPLDPANKYLYHSFVESPDMMNIYNGNVVLDDNGQAVIEMPAWFQALNQEFRYQLTTIGGFAPVYVAAEIADNKFSIAGGKPGMKVSWQVTGIRHDAYAQAHRIPVEEDKPADEQGKYLNPDVFGASPQQAIGFTPAPRIEHPEFKPASPLNEQIDGQ